MGLFVIDNSQKPNIKTHLDTVKNNLELFLRLNSENKYSYLINDFALQYLTKARASLSRLTNWHNIKPSQQTIDKFWEEFNESSKHSQSCNSIFISAFKASLYEHLNDLNLVENSSSDYILVEKDEYYENIVVPVGEFIVLRTKQYFKSGQYTNQVTGYIMHPESKKLSYTFEKDEITEVSKCMPLSTEI